MASPYTVNDAGGKVSDIRLHISVGGLSRRLAGRLTS